MATFVGPEQLAAQAQTHEGQFYWQSPANFVSPAGVRFGLQVDTAAGTHTWRLKAFRRDNASKQWTEADPGNGPRVGQPGVAFGLTSVAAGGYTAGSGVLDVVSTVGNPPFQGTLPFEVVLGNPVGPPGVLARLSVTAINTPTQFAVVAIVDGNVAGGVSVFQTTANPANVLETPNGCPTFILDPTDATKIICAFPEDTLSMLSFCVFDMLGNGGLGKFGPTTTGGPVVHGNDLVSAGRNYNDDTGAKTCVGLRVSDNTLLFNYQGAPETVAGVKWTRAFLVRYNRTTLLWSASTQLTGAAESLPYAAHGIVVDPKTNIAYATVVKPPNGLSFPNASDYALYCVPIDVDNTIQPRATMTTAVRQIREPLVGYPVLKAIAGPAGETFELLCTFMGGLIGVAQPNASIARGRVGLAPVFTVEQISTTLANAPGDGSALATVGCGIGPDGLAYAFWFGDNDPVSFFYRVFYSKNTGPGAGWSTPVELYRTISDDSIDFLDLGATVSMLPGLGFAIVGQSAFITPSSPGVDGAVYFEFLIFTGLQQVKITFWGKLRYLLQDTGGAEAAVQCVVGYPTEARAIAGRAGLEIELIPDPVAALEARRRYPCGPNTNIMAPEFLLGNQCADDTPEGYEDEPFTFFSPAITVPAGTTVYGTAVLIPGTEDVVLRRLRALITWNGEDPDGSPTFSLRLPNGYSMTGGDLLPLGGITGSTPDFPGLFEWMTIFPTILVKAGDRIILDMGDLFPGGGLTSITTVFEFDAVKRRKLT